MRIKSFFIMLITALVVPFSTQSHASVDSHAAVCQPANLQQAISRNLGWSQFGVTNNSPTNGLSFFVVCPLVFDENVEPDSIELSVEFLDGAQLGSVVTCTAIETDTGNVGGENSDNLDSSFSGSATKTESLGEDESFDLDIPIGENNIFFSRFDDEYSVVCSIPPQTRISRIGYFVAP